MGLDGTVEHRHMSTVTVDVPTSSERMELVLDRKHVDLVSISAVEVGASGPGTGVAASKPSQPTGLTDLSSS